MTGTTENFQVDLRGIVEILSHNLYSSPRVYVRELIQNARDAVVARGEDVPPVELVVDPAKGELTVRDYGIGLTEADARSLLSTIGASSKREELAAVRREYLGQFGIGLLSCFLVADQIEVTSRSARDPQAQTMRWVGHGDGTFTVASSPVPLAEPGTVVRVHARPDEAEWVGADRVHRLASEYAGLLAVPITVAVAGSREPAVPVSGNTAPWDLPEDAAADWCEETFGFAPLTSISLDVPILGIRGTAFVTGEASPGRGRAGDRVFSHGMSVASDNTQLVPEWVSFARVAIEAGSLGLTASRESLHESGALATAQEEIGHQVRAGIERLAAGDPDLFAQFSDVHGQSLLALAVAHPQMLEFVARHLAWETSAGPMRLVEMPARITFTTDDREFNTYASLVQAQGGLLVNGAYIHGAAMLRAYNQAQTRLTAREFELEGLLDDLPAPRREDAALAETIGDAARAVLDALGVAAEVRAFRPATQLVLHVPGRAAGFVFEEVEDDPWADLLGGATPIDPVGPADPRPILVLNLRAEAVRAVGGALAPAVRAESLRALHLLSLLQAGIRLRAEEQAGLAGALETLLLAAARTGLSTTENSSTHRAQHHREQQHREQHRPEPQHRGQGMTMIRHDEVAGLTGEQAQRVRALIDRSSEIWDMPEDLETIQAWEEQIAACEAEGVPHLAASARFGQYSIYSLGGMPEAALDAYVRLMQILARYGDHIHPENVRRFLGAVADLVVTVGEDPSLTRPQLERIVDLVEQQTVAHGFDLANVTLARASLAVEFGEQERAFALMDQWQGIGSPDWPPFDANTVTREVVILEPFDPALAAATLARRFTAMGVPPGPIDVDREDHTQLVLLRARLGSQSARAGRKEVAARIGDELVAQFGIDRLVRTAEIQDLLVVLEHRPDDARIVADGGLESSRLDHVDWRLQAALARNRSLEDPQGEEAALLRALATEAAAAHDARGGTDLHTRELQDFWLADLPAAAPGSSGADVDPGERAERILRAGWIPRRTSPVTMESVPFAMKDHYVELYEQAKSVTEAGAEKEVEAVVDATIARSRELGMPSAEFVVRLMHVFHAYEAEDHEALVLRFATAQEAQAIAPEGVEPALEKAAAGLFLPVCFIALDLPTIPLDRIGAMITAETALRAVTGMPTTPIAVAELARAAHLGLDAEYGPLFEEVRTGLAADAGDVDPFDVQLDLARILAPVDASAVPGLVEGVLRASNDPAQQRAALAWTVWAALQEGEVADDAIAAVIAQLEEVDRDFEEFGDLPRSVVLEIAARIPEVRGWAIDAALADTSPGDPTHLDTFAGAARLLLEHAPADERGPQLREDARQIAAALDQRNGNTVQSERLRTTFFPEE